MIGGLIFGYIADHYGRIPALVSCNAVGFFASIATAFCNSFWSFCLARLIVGSSFDNCFNVLFIIGKYRRDRLKKKKKKSQSLNKFSVRIKQPVEEIQISILVLINQ